jgi:D-alanine-D-alanine ligase
MNPEDLTIGVVYNLRNGFVRGEPRDRIAVDESAEVASSLRSALDSLGYANLGIPVRSSLENLEQELAVLPVDSTFVINLCEEFGGQNLGADRVARLIANLGFRYTGQPAGVTALCMDKALAKERFIKNGLPTPAYQVFLQPMEPIRVNFPAIVKPISEDASFGIDFESVVSTPDKLYERVAYILETYQQAALVEEFILGREITVSILGNRELEFLPLGEVDYSHIDDPYKRLLTYEAKWLVDSPFYQSTPIICPARVTPEMRNKIVWLAGAAYRAMGLTDYGRIDLRYSNGSLYILEANEAPDLAPDAGFFVSAKTAGYTYPQMIERIIRLALERSR